MPVTAIKGFKPTGGFHPETATLRSVLAHQGVKAAHTGKPWSEAMLLGLGGGLGAGYILWEFKKHGSASLVLGFQYKWNYPVQFMGGICKRAGVRAVVKETGGAQAASSHLDAALADGLPAITWVHESGLPHRRVARRHHECWGWLVNVYGRDDDTGEFCVEDLGKRPFRVRAGDMVAARGKIPSYKNRLMTIRPGRKTDLRKAITDGVKDCVAYLSSTSDSFGLPALRKWSRLMTDSGHAKGWPRVFSSRRGLFSTLRSIYEAVKHKGSEGAGLRFMYSEFLKEAAAPSDRPELREAARHYRKAGNQWIRLANTAFPDSFPEFRSVRDLLDRKYRLLKSGGQAAQAELEKIGVQLSDIYDRGDREFPLSGRAVEHLFVEIQAALDGLHHVELAAVEALRESVR